MRQRDGGLRRVLFVVPRFHNNLYFATKALVQAGLAVEVFALQSSPKETHSYVTPRSFAGDGDGAELRRALDEVDPDLVFIRRAPPLSHALARLCRWRRARVVHYDLAPADLGVSPAKRLLRRARGWPVRRVTPVPPAFARGAAPGVSLLPWPVERIGAAGALPPRGADGRLRLLCAAKLADTKKNQPWLIEAVRAAGLADRVRLTLAGSSSVSAAGTSEQQLAALRREAAASDWIDLFEDVPFAGMPDLYRAHDLCLLPSRREILGVAPLEGMAYGTIPVISRPSGSAGYVRHGGNGFRVDPTRSAELSDILHALVAAPARLGELSRAARETAETELSPRRFVERVRDLFA